MSINKGGFFRLYFFAKFLMIPPQKFIARIGLRFYLKNK
jgi:hypothetical protein